MNPSDAATPQAKPQPVQLAVTLLWVSFALSFPALAFGALRDPAEFLHPFAVVFTLAMLALGVLLIRRIDGGHNWARWFYLVLVGIAVALQFVPLDDPNPPGYAENALSIVGWALDAAALWLVFTRPGADWFRRRA